MLEADIRSEDGARPIRLLSIVGTRPEAIKIAPVALAAIDRPAVSHRILATGQHDALFADALGAFGLVADGRLTPVPADPSPDVMAARLSIALAPILAADPPDMVLVQGDTTSAYAAALAAEGLGIPVGHIEAGLRSHDLANPWPEERNRVAIDRVATLLFAPTMEAAANLEHDAEIGGHTIVTGNTSIDALLMMRAQFSDRAASRRGEPMSILLTCHRRESFGVGIEAICAAALRLADRGDIRILCPVHPNPAVGDTVRAMLGRHPAISLVGALGYAEMVAAMMDARLILTDSGGIQEEAPALGIPVLVLRDVTERPEGLASGNLALVGTDPDRIVATANILLDDPLAHAAMARPAFPFGDGQAATKILDGIEHYFSQAQLGDHSLPFLPAWTKDGAPKGAREWPRTGPRKHGADMKRSSFPTIPIRQR